MMMTQRLSEKLTVSDRKVDFKGKRVLIRVDFNVPLDDKGKVRDDTRIAASVPTINSVFAKGANNVVLMSHLGRPKGQRKSKFSLRAVVPKLETLLGRTVTFLSECVGSQVEKECKAPPHGSVILLENLRFHPEETGKGVDKKGRKVKAKLADIVRFRKSLSALGDVYVNDAFGTAHRAHSSMVGIHLPVRCAGLLLSKELEAFAKVSEQPARPFLAILGGAKVSDKIKLIDNLLDKVDELMIGGGMVYTFKKVLQGMAVGNSLYDAEGAKLVPKIVSKARRNGVKLHFPVDFTCGDKFAADAKVCVRTEQEGIPNGWMGLDCGPKTCVRFANVIWRAKTIVFNGPQGVFEFPAFATGTISALQACCAATQLKGAVSIVGGGDSAAASSMCWARNLVSHVSTGGGASLELLEGKSLPGIAILSDKDETRSRL